MKPVMVVVGTRPEIVKMAPIIRVLKVKHVSFIFAHCGQHYDYNVSHQFIEELCLPDPDYGYTVRAYSQGSQTARIMVHMEKLLKKVKPKIVLVEGDTNGVLATSLAAVKLDIPVGHVEAGLRSFDLRMPEEHNRRLTDHVSTLLFAPTKNAKRNLEKENVWGKIYVAGNTIIDAVVQHLPMAQNQSSVMKNLRFKEFALVTAHRAENVDNLHVLKNFIEAFMEAPIPIVYPVHPRTRKRLRQNRMWKSLCSSENVQLLTPVGYFDFLMLMKNCKLILTDSGGIQEEATAPPIRKSVLVMRLSTERPEAVKAGFAEVVGVKKRGILEAMECLLNQKKELPRQSPYGNGKAGEKIVKIVEEQM